MTDQVLLRRWYREQDAEAFKTVATRHARLVYGTGYRILGNAAEAEDVAQEAFLSLARAKNPPTRSAGAWLHRTATNKALDRIRSDQRRRDRETRFHEQRPVNDEPVWDDIRELVDEAVADLPERLRAPVLLYFFEDRTHIEIGEKLGLPRQTVTYRIGRGIERVRGELRRKGIAVPGAMALSKLVQTHLVESAPATLAAEIGRIALATKPAATTLGLLGGATVLKIAAGIVCTTAIGIGVWYATQNSGVGIPEIETVEPEIESGPVSSTSQDPPLIASVDSANASDSDESAPASETPIQLALTDAPGGESETNTGTLLTGTVRFPDGRAFANCQVTIINAEDLEANTNRKDRYFELTADSRGEFEQIGVPAGKYSLQVTEPGVLVWGKAFQILQFEVENGEHSKEIQVTYGSEGNLSIRGKVVDTAGNPIEKAGITGYGLVQRETLTDEFGRFELSYLPEGEVNVHADKQEYSGSGTSARAGDHAVILVLQGMGGIKGKVIDKRTGYPITRFEASFMNGHARAFKESLFGNRRTFNNEAGEFEFDHVYVGSVTVVARADGYAPAMADGSIEENRTSDGIIIALVPSRSFSGRVVSEEGGPIVNARIYMDNIPPPYDRDRNVVSTTDAKGVFVIENFPSDHGFLTAWHPGFAPGGASVTNDMEIVLRKAARINLRVTENGNPSPRKKVSLHSTEARVGYVSGDFTDENGDLTIAEVIPGLVILDVEIDSNRFRSEMLSLEPGETRKISLEISPAEAEVEGVVFLDNEVAFSGRAVLIVRTPTGMERFEVMVDDEGLFHMQNVPVGKAYLVVEAHFDRTFRQYIVDPVQLEAGIVTSLKIDVQGGVPVKGTVSNPPLGMLVEILALRGSLSFEDAIRASKWGFMSHLVGGFGGLGANGLGASGEPGVYETTLLQSGVFTLLVLSYPEADRAARMYHASQVIEIIEGEPPRVDFDLTGTY